MTKQPEQAIFDELFKVSKSKGYQTFLELPPTKTSYPFVVMGESYLTPQATSSYLVGEVEMVIHIWGTIKQRKKVSDCIADLIQGFGEIRYAGGYQVAIRDSRIRTIKDNSTLETLYHGILELDYVSK